MREVVITVADAAGLLVTPYGAGAVGRVQSCATETGIFADIASPTFALVAGTSAYSVWDVAGTATTWYRSRIESSGGGIVSDWTDAFQGMVAYATLTQLVERAEVPDTTWYGLLSDLLVNVSAQLDQECGRQFYRIPASGEAVRTYDGTGDQTLYVPEGIVSLSKVEYATLTGGTYAEQDSDDYFLRPKLPQPGWPYTELILSDVGQLGAWYEGYNTVRLTGVFGWSAIPPLVNEAVLELATRSYHQVRTRDSGVGGLPEVGVIPISANRPDAWYQAVRAYGRKLGIAV